MEDKEQSNNITSLRKWLYDTLAIKATEMVEKYAEQHKIPPIDPLVLIKDIEKDNIEIQEDNASIYAGYSKVPEENQKKYTIFYKNIYPRKFFTIAHELAHYYILNSIEFQKKLSLTQNNSGGESIEKMIERACDVFAVNLLLPAKYMLPFTRKLNKNFDFNTLRAICNSFRVSEETFIRRLNEIKLLEMPNLLIIFKRVPYFDSRNPQKMKRDIKWRVWHRATPQKIFIPRNIPAEKIGFSVGSLKFGMKKTTKRRRENINLKIFDKKWIEKDFKVFSQYTNKDDNTVIAMIKIIETESIL